jgi:hypothetical protein
VDRQQTDRPTGETSAGAALEDDHGVTTDALNAAVAAFGLVPVPPALMPRVLHDLRSHRAMMRRLVESGLIERETFPAQVFRPGSFDLGGPA